MTQAATAVAAAQQVLQRRLTAAEAAAQHQLQRRLTAAEAAAVNSVRVSTVMERLGNSLKSNHTDLNTFTSQCLTLSRGIDNALANNEQPDSAKDIPGLLKLLCQRKNVHNTQACMMVLLISVKNACKVGWFSEEERQEIFALANKIGSNFCTSEGINVISISLPTIETVMQRFYPQIKMGHVLTVLEVKPGYGVYTNDFHILKKTACSPEDKIRLLVAQLDNLDTSACIISPPQVNFIINGTGVDKRTNISMDTGPQLPTNVTPSLKYGTNLLQAVGQFKGTYIIAVAFMYEMPLSDPPVLPDHVQSSVNGSDSDPDLIEGPSRISLNCPISYTRIKLPVKGHKCKHLQCFDYSNFISINSRRPSWRCPHCNQYACYTDIRVDQNMCKVLKEVGGDVADVIISADGSWKAVLENDDHDQVSDINLDSLKETPEPRESADPPNAPPTVVDLTADEDGAMDIDAAFEIEDMKPSISDLFAQPHGNDTSGVVNQNVAVPIDDDFWVGLNDPTAGVEIPAFAGIPNLTPSSYALTLNPETIMNLVNTSLGLPDMQNQNSTPTNFPLQQTQLMNSASSNEYGRFASVNINRLPIAVQALPAQSPVIQRTRPSVSSVSSTMANGLNTVYTDFERQQLFSRSIMNQPQVAPVVGSSALPQHNFATSPNQTRQVQNPYGSNSLGGFQNPHLQQVFNPRLPQPPNAIRSPSSSSHSLLSRTMAPPLGGTQQQTRMAAASPVQRTVQINNNRQHHASPVQSQSPRLVPILPANSPRVSPAADSPEQNWQPAGRMRGSLAGRDLTHLRDQVIQPTQQQSQPARTSPPPPVPVSAPMTIEPELHALIANHRNASQPQPQNHDAAQG